MTANTNASAAAIATTAAIAPARRFRFDRVLPLPLPLQRIRLGRTLLDDHLVDLLDVRHHASLSAARPCEASTRTVDGLMPRIWAACSEP